MMLNTKDFLYLEFEFAKSFGKHSENNTNKKIKQFRVMMLNTKDFLYLVTL